MLVQALGLSSRRADTRARPRRRGYGRAVILDVVRQLLRERSLDGLAMELVAQEAGLTRRTIYNHFASAAELFEISRKSLLSGLAPLVPTEVSPSLPMATALTRFAGQAMRVFSDERHLDLLLSVVRDGHANPWIVTAYESEIQAPMSDALVAYLSSARDVAQFAGDPRGAAFQLLWTLQAAATSINIFNRDHADGQMSCNIDSVVRAFVMQHAYPERIAA